MPELHTKDKVHLVHLQSNNGSQMEYKMKINNKIECRIKDSEHHQEARIEARHEEKKRIQEDDSKEPAMLD